MIYPSLNGIKKLGRRYNRIPVYRELNLSEIGLLALLKALESEKNIIFLESARENKKWSRFSFLGLNPKKVISFTPPSLRIFTGNNEITLDTDPFDFLSKEISANRSPSFAKYGSFNGGLVGYFGYEMVNYCGILRKKILENQELPVTLLAHIDDLIVYDNVKSRFYICTSLYIDNNTDTREEYEKTLEYLEKMEEQLLSLIEKTSFPYLPSRPEEVRTVPVTSREEYMENVSRTRELITSGEAIQVVISNRTQIEDPIDPYKFYLKLRALNPSPYMFYLKFDDLFIVGSSPEIHVKTEDRTAYLKPIAGTIKQAKSKKENLANKETLLSDPKERAEHLMLVDLARNDLGRIAAKGSVKVESFMLPEDYSHVIHLVSLVSCTISEGRNAIDVLRETFPAGTVSGAPKVRAIEIIDELERHPRDIYAGAVGYIGFNGFMDTCITIRTAVFRPGNQYIQAGAGIVYDSVPEKEYEETRSKLQALSISLQFAKKKEVSTCS